MKDQEFCIEHGLQPSTPMQKCRVCGRLTDEVTPETWYGVVASPGRELTGIERELGLGTESSVFVLPKDA